jgi:hypothetical protein
MERMILRPSKAFEPLLSENPSLLSAVQQFDDDNNYSIGIYDDHEYWFYVGSCTHSPSSQMTLWARKTTSAVATVNIWPWDGWGHKWWTLPAYTCEFDSTEYTACSTDNLADTLNEEDGYMKVKLEPLSWGSHYGPMEFDYVSLDVICIL